MKYYKTRYKRKKFTYGPQRKPKFKQHRPKKRYSEDVYVKKGRYRKIDDVARKGRVGRANIYNPNREKNLNRSGNEANLNRKGNIANLNRKGNPQNLRPWRGGRKKGAKDKKPRKKGGNRRGNPQNLKPYRGGRKPGSKNKHYKDRAQRKSNYVSKEQFLKNLRDNFNKGMLTRAEYQRHKYMVHKLGYAKYKRLVGLTKDERINKIKAMIEKAQAKKNAKQDSKGFVKKGNPDATRSAPKKPKLKDLKDKVKKEKKEKIPRAPIHNLNDMIERFDEVADVLLEYGALTYWNSFISGRYVEWVLRVMEELNVVGMGHIEFLDTLRQIDGIKKKKNREEIIEIATQKEMMRVRNKNGNKS